MLLPEQPLTTEELAEIFKIDNRTIYCWIEKKTIPYIINKKVIRFSPVVVEEFIQKYLVKVSDFNEIFDKIISKIS